MASPSTFQYDSEDRMVVYCDGCCINNGIVGEPKRGGIGVYFGPNNKLNYSGAVDGKPTNNIAEIQAAIKAVSLCKSTDVKKVFVDNKKEPKFCIKTDSDQVVKAMNEWKPKWEAEDFKGVVNAELYKKLFAISEGMDVIFVHVKGHAKKGLLKNDSADKTGNDAADALANKGAENAPEYFD